MAHASRLFFQPLVGRLPSARHSSHVIGFLKSNLLPAFLRNCDRGKLRSHTWHVIGFPAASMDACSFFAVKPLALSFRGVGQHSMHMIFIFGFVRYRQSSGQKDFEGSNLLHRVHVSRARDEARLRSFPPLPPSLPDSLPTRLARDVSSTKCSPSASVKKRLLNCEVDASELWRFDALAFFFEFV